MITSNCFLTALKAFADDFGFFSGLETGHYNLSSHFVGSQILCPSFEAEVGQLVPLRANLMLLGLKWSLKLRAIAKPRPSIYLYQVGYFEPTHL